MIATTSEVTQSVPVGAQGSLENGQSVTVQKWELSGSGESTIDLRSAVPSSTTSTAVIEQILEIPDGVIEQVSEITMEITHG